MGGAHTPAGSLCAVFRTRRYGGRCCVTKFATPEHTSASAVVMHIGQRQFQGCRAVPGLLPKGRAQRQSGRGVSDHARERRLSQRDVTWGVLALVRTHTCPDLIARSGLVSLGESVQNQATGMPEPLGRTKVLFPANIAQDQF